MDAWDIIPERMHDIINKRGEIVTIQEIDIDSIESDDIYEVPIGSYDDHITETTHTVIIQNDRFAGRREGSGTDIGQRFIIFMKDDNPVKKEKGKEYRVIRSTPTASGEEFQIISVTEYRARNINGYGDLIYKKGEMTRRFDNG